MFLWLLLAVVLLQLPFPCAAGEIAGPGFICPNQTHSYTAITFSNNASYAWFIGADSAGALILGETNQATVEISTATGGSFTLNCLVDIDGTNDTATKSITVNSLVTATALTPQTACPGDTVVFSTSVTGADSPIFVWRHNGSWLPEADSDTLTLTNISAADAGSYCVEIYGSCNAVTNCAPLDLPPPATLLCPPDQTFQCLAEVPAADPAAVFATNAVSVAHVGDSMLTNGCVLILTRTYAAENSCGSLTTCEQVIVIADTTPPVFAGQTSQIVESGEVWAFIPPKAADLCAGTNITLLALPPTTNALGGNSFTATQVWQATDPCGNAAFFTQTVTVGDIAGSPLICASNRVVECGEAWDFQPPDIVDLCGGTDVVVAVLATTTNQLGGGTFSATRVWSATDACNNSNICSQTITLVDGTPPQIFCPADIVVECAGAAGTAVTFQVTASDVCDPDVAVVTFPPSGSVFALGTNTVRCVATDASGNTNQCTFQVIVRDTTPPVIACPPNLIVSEAPRDSGGAVVTFAPPTVMDLCDAAPQLYSSHAPGQMLPTGTNLVTWTAVDASGNSNSCTFAVRVIPYRLFVVTNTDDAGPGSLRQALLDANDAPDENLILFDLPGHEAVTIQLLSPLPPITSPTIIDGWSYSGANAPPAIELVAVSNSLDGLVIQSGFSTVRGLALHGFATAIRLEGGTNVIQGNYLGVDLSGTNAPGNSGNGLYLASSRNQIGGNTPGTGNVLSGNGGHGITLEGAAANNNVIQGNIMGAATDGLTPLPNAGHGVFLTSQASRNVLGGSVADTANLIAFNAGAGVALDPSAGNRNVILANSIFENDSLGIDLGADGVTPNDASDTDTGPNALQNFPVLADARSAAGVTVIEGELTSTPNTTYRIEFFLSDVADPTGHGEGQIFIGATQVTVGDTGPGTFSASFPLTAIFTQYITATATDPQGNTSEFSAAVRVRTPPVIEAQPQGTNSTPGETVTLCAVASGTPPITYQWRLNGVNIPGATNACYNIPSTALADGGTYTVVIGNELDAFASTAAALILGGGDILNLPTGDNFADAVSLSEYGYGTNGVVAGDNSLATLEPFEPVHAGQPGGRSVWYRWCTPNGSKGIATFRTTGSTFDTLMAVYQGTSLSNLVEVASDEDNGGFYSSEVRFNAFYNLEENSCYYIAIDALGGTGGQFVLSWAAEKTPHMLPVILLPPLSQTVPPGASVTFSNYSVPECARGHLDCNHDHWEVNFNQKEKLTYQWYFNNQPLAGATNASLTLPAVQAQHVGDYRVRVFTPWQYLDSRKATLQINLTGEESQPVLTADKFLIALLGNPLFIGSPAETPPFARGQVAASTVVRGFTGTHIFNTTGSATAPGEVICGVTGGASEWLTFVAEQTGTLFLNTEGSTYDTVMAVFRRNPTNAAALELLACDNDSGAGTTSALNVPVVAGQTNYVLVDGVNGAMGILQLNYSLATTTILRIIGQTPEGANVVQVNGRPALNFSLQASTNFVNWTTLVTTNAPDGVFNYPDPGSIPLSRRYYRALILP